MTSRKTANPSTVKALPSHATAIHGLIRGVLCSFRVHTVDLWIGRLDDFAREVYYGVRPDVVAHDRRGSSCLVGGGGDFGVGRPRGGDRTMSIRRAIPGIRSRKVENATAVIWKALLIAEKTFRRLDAPELLADVASGVVYVNGVRAMNRRDDKAAAYLIYTLLDKTSGDSAYVQLPLARRHLVRPRVVSTIARGDVPRCSWNRAASG